jgi:hypothetical protein
MPSKTLAIHHKKSDCFHPKFHPEAPRFQSMVILQYWLAKNGYGFHEYESKPLIRVAPLCEFGGVMWKDDFGRADAEEASGTWAVCPNCEAVEMCGFCDDGTIHPDICEKCNTPLSLADYFQGVYKKPVQCAEKGFCLKHQTIHSPEVKREIRRNMISILKEKGPLEHRIFFDEIAKRIPDVAAQYGDHYFEYELRGILLRMLDGNEGLIHRTADCRFELSLHTLTHNIEF